MTSLENQDPEFIHEVYRREGVQQAINKIEELISHSCNNAQVLHSLTDFTLGTLKDDKLTIALCWRLAELRKDFWLPYARLAECYIRLSLFNEAVKACIEGITRNCNSDELQDKLFEVIILAQEDEKDKCLEIARLIEEASERFPGYTVLIAAKHLIIILDSLNREEHEECNIAIESAGRALPNDMEIIKKLKELRWASEQPIKRLHVVILTCLKAERLKTFSNISEIFQPFLGSNNSTEVQLHILIDTNAVKGSEWQSAKETAEEIRSIYGGFSYHFGSSKDGFDTLRNHCFEWTTPGDWILMVDDDEVLFHSFPNMVIPLLHTEFNTADLVWLPRLNTIVERDSELEDLPVYSFPSPGTLFYPDYQARLFRNLSYIKYFGKVHESIRTSLIAKHPTKAEMHIVHHKTRKMQSYSDYYWNNLALANSTNGGSMASDSERRRSASIEEKLGLLRQTFLTAE